MSPQTSLTLLLTALLFTPRPAHADPAPDPCASPRAATRDAILAAFPGKNELWEQTLNKRGIAKVGTEWLQYFNGGSATASNQAFIRVLEDYCTERVRASQRALTEAANQTRADQRREKNRAEAEARFVASSDIKRVEKAKQSLTLAERLKKLFAAENEQKESDVAAPAPPSAEQCQQWSNEVGNCEAAGIETESKTGYGLATEAKCHRARANFSSCSRK
ncbi:MAG: hypothetical protein HY923_01260 [Elusimicrobia bacterium]|nr:hypothetical protein [Elusimicrobiota bacterium]